MVETLIGREIHAETYSHGGTFYPKSKLEHDGYDMDSIIPRLSPKDIEECPILGTTYRIPVKTTGYSTRKEVVRETRATRQSQPAAKRPRIAAVVADPLPVGDDDEQLALEDGRASSSSSESSSSSSSSSHKKKKKSKKSKKSKKKSKKDKKNKKDKKHDTSAGVSAAEARAQVMIDRAREKESNKLHAGLVKNAESVAGKLPATVSFLKNLLDNELVEQVAPILKDPVTAAVEKFEGHIAAATGTIAAGGKNSSAASVPLWADLSKEVTATKKQANLLSTILATMQRAAGHR